jgi:ABC-type dipeptide/oligopeptide/nickel transport system permease subunit
MVLTEQALSARTGTPGLPTTGPTAPPRRGPTTPRGRALQALVHDPSALLGLGLFLCIVLLAVFADQLAPYDPSAVHMRDRRQLPSATYLFGTDELGRDLLSRLIYGARVSLAVGVIATGIAAGVGIALGLASGFYGGKVDTVVMRALDGLLAFPAIILALAIISALGPSPGNAMIAIGVVSIPTFARLTRGTVLALKDKEFVEASRACGATAPYVMLRVLLPNCLSPLLVQASVAFANAILTEAALSFLGLGVQPPTPSWGSMLDTGRKYLDQTPWYSFSAGAAIFLAVLSLNLLGDGLRDALDPRIRRGAGG